MTRRVRSSGGGDAEPFSAEWTAPAAGGTIRFGASRGGPFAYGSDTIEFNIYQPDVKVCLCMLHRLVWLVRG